MTILHSVLIKTRVNMKKSIQCRFIHTSVMSMFLAPLLQSSVDKEIQKSTNNA